MNDFFTNFTFYIFPIVLSLLAMAVTYFIKKACAKYGTKVDVDLKNITETLLLQIIQQGVAYAEQSGKNYVKQHGGKPDSASKMSAAMQFIADELKRNNIPEISEKEIKRKIEAMLGIETMNEVKFPMLPDDIDMGGDNYENFDN